MYAYGLQFTIFLPTLVLIAQAVFLLQHEQTDRQTKLQMQLITFTDAAATASDITHGDAR